MFIFEKQLFPVFSQKKIEAANFLRFGKNFCKLLKAINTFNSNKKMVTNLTNSTLREKCSYSEFFCSVFSGIWTEYQEIWSISPYSVRIRENTEQKNFAYGHFSRSGTWTNWTFKKIFNEYYVVSVYNAVFSKKCFSFRMFLSY